MSCKNCQDPRCLGHFPGNCPQGKISTSCVFFDGINTPSAGITSGMTLTEIIVKMAGLISCVSPSITVQPVSAQKAVGDPISLTVVAGGTGLSYQWYKNGAIIPGAQSATYSKSVIDASDFANYFVKVTNACGNIDSQVAVISASPVTVAYFGVQADDSLPPDPTTLGGSIGIQTGQSVEADYTSNTTPSYLLMAEPITEPVKTKWKVTELNQGNIGTDSSTQELFYYVVQGSYRIYLTTYKTIVVDAPVVFSAN